MSKLIGDPNRGGREVCEALGIDPDNVRSLVIKFVAGTAAELVIRRYVSGEDVKKVSNVLEKYFIEPKF